MSALVRWLQAGQTPAAVCCTAEGCDLANKAAILAALQVHVAVLNVVYYICEQCSFMFETTFNCGCL
jgi:hypothetical protein